MRTTALLLLLAGLSLLALTHSAAQNPPKPEPAELVLKNGVIYTVNDAQPKAEALATRYGRIIFVGSSAEVKQYEGKSTRVIDLKGKTVVPGMIDAHYHFAGVGQREMTLNLEGVTSLEEFLAKLKARVDKA